jgi:DNA-binding IclR family transcriptional regulator
MSSLGKIFTTIETVVSEQELGVPFSAIVAKTGLPKASVHRTLKGLTELGYLNFNSATKHYYGSLRLAALGAEVISKFDLRDHLHPKLQQMHDETNQTCNAAILENDQGIFIDKIEAKHYGIRLFSAVGKCFPLHSTALGKVFLAYNPTIAEKILRRKLQAYTDNTITEAPLLRRELATIRKIGYAIDNEEITRGVICVAAPVFGISDEVTCAISITFQSHIYHDRGIDPEIDVLKRYSTEISGHF